MIARLVYLMITAAFAWPAAADPLTPRDVAFMQVKIGMTLDEVRRISQLGNKCTNWPKQSVPTCGPLHYFSDVRTVETASETIVAYSYGNGREIVLKNGVVVLIRR